jgi:guanine deaminase
MNHSFMQEAIRLSLEKMREGCGGPFGAVVVKDGRIISRGWNRVTTSNDPTAHAEVVAIREACAALNSFSLQGCELYASCEPCPMCLGAIYWSRVDRIFFAATRQDAAAAGFDDALIYEEVPRPICERRLPTVQMLREESLAAFREWKTIVGKVTY